MEIDWKQLAKTEGYKSLKAAYIHDVQDAARSKTPLRDKAEFLRLFNWAISRAKHYAHRMDVSIEVVLNKWEEDRRYWWLNFYQDCRQPKLHSNSVAPVGVKGTRKYYKNSNWYKNDPVQIRKMMQKYLVHVNQTGAKKTKPRWSTARKKRGH